MLFLSIVELILMYPFRVFTPSVEFISYVFDTFLREFYELGFQMCLLIFMFYFSQCSVDFPAAYQDWTATDPLTLFQAPVLKTESNPKV